MARYMLCLEGTCSSCSTPDRLDGVQNSASRPFAAKVGSHFGEQRNFGESCGLLEDHERTSCQSAWRTAIT